MTALTVGSTTNRETSGPGGHDGARLMAATALLVGWLLLLLFGHRFGAAVHLLLAAALLVVPWRLLHP
jgi:hypothetical protein